MAELGARADRAEKRAAEADKDNESLLKAVDALKTQQAAPARAPASAAPRTEEDERLAYERAYQQELARHRAQEAKGRANLDEAVSRLDDASAYHRLIAVARAHARDAEFQAAIRAFNQAMRLKPANLCQRRDETRLERAV